MFHASTCFGTCPEINLEINADEKIKIKSLFYKAELLKDDVRSGSFVGQLDNETFEELKKLIIQSRLTTHNINDKELCCDGAIKTIITYHNGKRNYVKTMFEPMILGKLIHFLYEIDTKVNLEKTNMKFKFEQ
ncbi:DUF6438 domain-containing protein [Flavobacterium gilvum]|uniref:DUF6438 domain-containing protein n=1 Tax=Flavobacterium gilvum TaxID=1492737 RepID=UPI0021CD52A2|nr:DUF6438 domain-containing protein [Flavobacterium gilvum]